MSASAVDLRRLLVTAVAVVGVVLLARVPLPGMGPAVLSIGVDPAVVGIFGLGLAPLVTAAVLAHVFAAIVPRWRALRSGPGGREPINRQVTWITLVLALFQASQAADIAVALDPESSRGLIIVSLVAGLAVMLVVARLVDRYGLGAGVATLVVLPMAPTVVGELASTVGTARINHSDDAIIVFGSLFISVVGVLAFSRRRDVLGSPWRLPLSGLVPIPLVVNLSVFLLLHADGNAKGRDWTGLTELWVPVIGALAFALWMASIFNGAGAVEALESRAADAGFGLDELPERRKPLARTVGLVVGLTILDWVLARRHGLSPNILFAVLVLALFVDDLRDEWRFGASVPVWTDHRTYALAAAERALTARQIPSFARHANLRTGLQIFGAWAPLELRVKPEHAEEARVILSGLLE